MSDDFDLERAIDEATGSTKHATRDRPPTIRTAWDLDYTLAWPKPSLTGLHPKAITFDCDPELHPLMGPFSHEVKCIITGRAEKYLAETKAIIRHLGLAPAVLLMNPIEYYSQDHIAMMKVKYLELIKAKVYVEENAHYRFVMKQWWNGECVSVMEWLRDYSG